MMFDFIDKIEFPDVLKNKYFNELQTLDNLWQGMCFIYKLTSELERKMNEQIDNGTFLLNMQPEARKNFEGKNIRYFSCGNDPVLKWLNKGLLYSLFQWYAVSACNYVRLVGFLAKKADSSRQKSIDYVKNIIPEIQCFRDKIAAHPARVCYHKNDNKADRIASVFYQIAFDNGRFQAQVWQLTIGGKDEKIKNENPGSWSITETHEKLIARYKHEK